MSVVAVLLCAVGVAVALGQKGRSGIREAVDWDLVVRPTQLQMGQQEGREAFWIGLRNLARQPRAVCLGDVTYDVINERHMVSATVDGFSPSMSPHTCSTPTGAHLILPGETLFVHGNVSVPDWAAQGQEVTFAISFVGASLRDWGDRGWMLVESTHPLRREPGERAP